MNLTEHLAKVISTLDEAGIDYALCGGLALAVHGHPRFTADIDLLVHPDDIENLLESVRPLGFVIPAQPMVMTSSEGSIEIRRISAADEQQLVTLDILLVSEATQAAWDSRRLYNWEHGQLSCVSRDGLRHLKRISDRPQDKVDLEQLGNENDAEESEG